MINYRGYGEISYGDNTSPLISRGIYVFPPTYTLSFNVKPVMSDNGVSVKYNRNELTINWVLPFELVGGRYNPNNDPESVDTAVQQIKAILMQPRKRLRCVYQGLGPARGENLAGFDIYPQDDKAGGPTPLDFKWKVLATHRCVEMTWTVAFHTTNCITFDENNQIVLSSTESAFNDFVWSRSYDVDESGCVTITTTGQMERSTYGVGSHIDEWRILATFRIPTFCHRISQKFQHDPTTRITNFTIIDKEVSSTENALPPMVQSMDLTHEMNSSLVGGGKYSGVGFTTWANSFEGTITLPPNAPPLFAYFVFHFYLRQRMHRVAKGGAYEDQAPVPTKNEKGETSSENVKTVLTRISYKESLFSRTHSFKAEYFAVYDRKKFIAQSGIFLPLYNYTQSQGSKDPKFWFHGLETDYEPWSKDFDKGGSKNSNTLSSQFLQWRNFLEEHHDFGNPYGYLFFRENPASEANIFIPCDYTDIRNTNEKQSYIPNLMYKGKAAWEIEGGVSDKPEYERTKKDTNLSTLNDADGKIDPKVSWVAYSLNTTILENHNTIQVVRQSYDESIKLGLQSFNGIGKPNKEYTKFSTNNGTGTATIPGNYDPPADEVVSTYNGQSNTVVLLTGYAVRVGYPCPMPSVISYKSNPVYRAGQAMYSNKIISKGEIPVYLATWSIPYYIDKNRHIDVFNDLNVNGYSGDLG